MIALDTNLLVYAHCAAAPEHQAAKALIELALQKGPVGIAQASVAEFWCVVTAGQKAKSLSSPKLARGFLSGLKRAGVKTWQPPDELELELIQHARHHDIRGARIFDLVIAFTARAAGTHELWTHDGAFASVAPLRIVHVLSDA